MLHARQFRGQPLVILALLLGSWVFLRAMTWHEPTWLSANQGEKGAVDALISPVTGDDRHEQAQPGLSRPLLGTHWDTLPPLPYWPGGPDPHLVPAYPAPSPMMAQRLSPMSGPEEEAGRHGQEPMLAAGHQLMWMAALARVAVPPEIASYVGQSIPAAPAPVPLSPGLAASGKPDRWSADAWMLMRREGVTAAPGSRPLYGASQIGAVARFRLAPDSAHHPIAYVRGSSALGGIRESEVAAGLGLRPIAGLPLMVAGEARAFRSGGETSFRPAGLAYTELAPFELPMGLRGEAYLQGGYVGGAYKTAFVDGQFRLDREVMRIGGMDVRLGGGIWGGAQKGASRLDIGPGVHTRMNMLGRPSQVTMDWRFRVAGDAEPGSGPALTVATGF